MNLVATEIVFEHNDRGYLAAASFPAGLERTDLQGSLRDAPFITSYCPPDGQLARLAIVISVAYGQIDERYAPERLAERIGVLTRWATPGEDLLAVAELKRAIGAGPDVFISHAHEDLEEVAEPLAEVLRARGLYVWLNDIRVGRSIRREIDAGLYSSRGSVIILSSAFFRNYWPNEELDGLVALEEAGRIVILPIWHGVGKEDVLRYSPPLSSRMALRTSAHSIEQIADAVYRELRADHHLPGLIDP